MSDKDERERADHLGEAAEAGFETLAIHAGQEPDPVTGAVIPPLHLATTYAHDGVGGHRGFEYSRTGNPTRASLEHTLATLERATSGFGFASGMAAEDALLRILGPGDHLLIPNDAYGGTFRLVARVLSRFGITYTPVDLTDNDAVAASWSPATRLVWIETPSNPLLNICDIEALAEIAHRPRRLVRRRQHLCHPVPPAALDARRRRRRPLGYEISRRPLRRRWRLRRHA